MSVFGKKALSHWNWEMPESSLGNETVELYSKRVSVGFIKKMVSDWHEGKMYSCWFK